MHDHAIHCRDLKPQLQLHNVTPARAFRHAFVPVQGLVARLRRGLKASGRHDQALGACPGITAHLDHLGWPLLGACMICFGNSSCSAFAWRGAMLAGLWCPRRCQTDTANISLPTGMRPTGMVARIGPAGPPDRLLEEQLSTHLCRCCFLFYISACPSP